MNKTDIHRYAKKGWPDSKKIVDRVFRGIIGALLEREEVRITYFGTFKVVKTNQRVGYDFRAGKVVTVKPKLKIKFHASPRLTEVLNERNITAAGRSSKS